MIRMPISHQIASIIHLSCEKCTPRDFIQLFSRLFLGVRKVAYALLTHPPLVSSPKTLLPFDLHVLSLPQAFILSQDQTLHCKKLTLPAGQSSQTPYWQNLFALCYLLALQTIAGLLLHFSLTA